MLVGNKIVVAVPRVVQKYCIRGKCVQPQVFEPRGANDVGIAPVVTKIGVLDLWG